MRMRRQTFFASALTESGWRAIVVVVTDLCAFSARTSRSTRFSPDRQLLAGSVADEDGNMGTMTVPVEA